MLKKCFSPQAYNVLPRAPRSRQVCKMIGEATQTRLLTPRPWSAGRDHDRRVLVGFNCGGPVELPESLEGSEARLASRQAFWCCRFTEEHQLNLMADAFWEQRVMAWLLAGPIGISAAIDALRASFRRAAESRSRQTGIERVVVQYGACRVTLTGLCEVSRQICTST